MDTTIPAHSIEIELDEYTDTSEFASDGHTIPVPTFASRLRKTRRAVAPHVALAQDATDNFIQEKIKDPLAQVHTISAQDAGAKAHRVSQRVVAETGGFFKGLTALVTGAAVGTTTGALAGTRKGLASARIEALRANPDGLVAIGVWDAVHEGKIFCSLNESPLPGRAFVPKMSFGLGGAFKERINLGSGLQECVVVPTMEKNQVVGIIIFAQDESQQVYRYTDEENPEGLNEFSAG